MAINNRRPPNPTFEGGWPFINYASEDRNLNSSPDVPQTGAISIPRFKFTWLAEFQINERVFENPVTNLGEFLNNGKIYVQLLSIDHPKPEMEFETLRSYNKWIKVPKIVKYPPASMTFHDDSTAVTQALWKEYLNFYTHQATIGDGIAGGNTTNLRSSNEINSYQFTHILTGEEVRSRMGDRPSLGMKLKANDMRHFFEAITIYDLGTDPDGVNVYWFHRPVITTWDHENLDKEDRTGNVKVTANFEYEGYYYTIGKNRSQIRSWIETILGTFPDFTPNASPRKAGIARDVRADNRDTRVSNWDNGPFPGEDALIQQALNGSPAEQLASTLPNTAAQQAVNDAKQVGYDDFDRRTAEDTGAVTFPLPERDLPGFEPLTPSQTTSQFPSTINGKRAELDRIDSQLSEIAPDTTDPRTLEKRMKLQNRKGVITQALNRQRAEDLARRTGSTSSKSALQNTENAFGVGQSTTSGTIPNPANQLEADRLYAASGRKQAEATRFAELAEENRILAQSSADAGDFNAADAFQAVANENSARSFASQTAADVLMEEAQRIDPSS